MALSPGAHRCSASATPCPLPPTYCESDAARFTSPSLNESNAITRCSAGFGPSARRLDGAIVWCGLVRLD
eukprot:7271343-Prymnesium_polylepis.2